MQPQRPRPKNKKGISEPIYTHLNPFKAQEKRYKLYYGRETDFSGLHQPLLREIDGFMVSQLPYPSGAYYVRGFNNAAMIRRVAS